MKEMPTLQPHDMVRQVAAIENMYFSKNFIEKMVKVANGELSSDEVRQEVIREYVQAGIQKS